MSENKRGHIKDKYPGFRRSIQASNSRAQGALHRSYVGPGNNIHRWWIEGLRLYALKKKKKKRSAELRNDRRWISGETGLSNTNLPINQMPSPSIYLIGYRKLVMVLCNQPFLFHPCFGSTWNQPESIVQLPFLSLSLQCRVRCGICLCLHEIWTFAFWFWISRGWHWQEEVCSGGMLAVDHCR